MRKPPNNLGCNVWTVKTIPIPPEHLVPLLIWRDHVRSTGVELGLEHHGSVGQVQKARRLISNRSKVPRYRSAVVRIR
jgi:hypothetical protein